MKTEWESTLSNSEIELIIKARLKDPFSLLGMHAVQYGEKKFLAVRAFIPHAVEVQVVDRGNKDKLFPMRRIHPDGLFETVIEGETQFFTYMLRTTDKDGDIRAFRDPYTFPPVLTEYELYLHGEGNYHLQYEKFGGVYMELDGCSGIAFVVWAPNAGSVSVAGEFNGWDWKVHQLRMRGSTGVWELFLPEIEEGSLYKFRINSGYDGLTRLKADPFARFSEIRPETASITYNIDNYDWNDDAWMKTREKANSFSSPISIYEVHLGSWMRIIDEENRSLTYRELAEKLAEYVKDMGFTHIQLLPVMEHPFDGSWGYQQTGYFSPTSRFGTPDDFMYFVDKMHQNNIGVILDWVPAHFPADAHGLALFDGTRLYEHHDPRKGFHKDWKTLIFNYGRNEILNFLIASGLFWLDKYHADGLRVDAVASMLYLDYSRNQGEWVPNIFGGKENLEAIEFIKRFNELAYKYFPGVVIIAEESTAWPGVTKPAYRGGLGFGMKWNMGWMHDMLKYMSQDPLYRKFHHSNLTFSLLYAFSENYILPLSHDEVVHGKASMLGKMPGDEWRRFANLRLIYAYMFGHPGKKLLFMGGEIGQRREWDHDGCIDWHLLQSAPHKSLQRYFKDLNLVYGSEPSMFERDGNYKGFKWIDFKDVDNCIVSYLRFAEDTSDFTVFIFNFTPVVRKLYRFGVPRAGEYKVLINSDNEIYFGSGLGPSEKLKTEQESHHGFDHSIELTLPPLGALILKPLPEGTEFDSPPAQT